MLLHLQQDKDGAQGNKKPALAGKQAGLVSAVNPAVRGVVSASAKDASFSGAFLGSLQITSVGDAFFDADIGSRVTAVCQQQQLT